MGSATINPVANPRREGRRSKVNKRPIWMEKPNRGVQTIKVLVIVLIVFVMLYPFAHVILGSFGTSHAYKIGGLIPSVMSLDAYKTVLSGGVVSRALLVSGGVTIVGTTLSVFFTSILAYALTRTKDVPGTKLALYAVLLTMLFGAGIIPNFLLVKGLGLIDSYWSLILPTLISAFNMIVIRNFFMQLPGELLEAARIDGAGEWRIFATIVMPLSKAVIAVIALFYAVGYWNSFFNAMIYLNDTSKWPIQLVLNQYVLQGSALSQIQNPEAPVPPAESIQLAVVVLATLPILLVYPFAQKYFTKGVLTGAIKG